MFLPLNVSSKVPSSLKVMLKAPDSKPNFESCSCSLSSILLDAMLAPALANRLSDSKTIAGSEYSQVPTRLFLLACFSLEKMFVKPERRLVVEDVFSLLELLPVKLPKMLPKSICAFAVALPASINAMTSVLINTFFFINNYILKCVAKLILYHNIHK